MIIVSAALKRRQLSLEKIRDPVFSCSLLPKVGISDDKWAQTHNRIDTFLPLVALVFTYTHRG